MAILFGVAEAASCGAVTLEAQPPEEPLPDAAAPPRLLRPEAGAAANATGTSPEPPP